MWTVQMFDGQQFHLTDGQKDLYLNAVKNGAKMVNFGEFILSDRFSYIISDKQQKIEQLKKNPILNDPDFGRYLETKSPSLADTLDRRYASPKYQQDWDEAYKNKDYLKSVEVVK